LDALRGPVYRIIDPSVGWIVRRGNAAGVPVDDPSLPGQ
jgi:hypothetical protein